MAAFWWPLELWLDASLDAELPADADDPPAADDAARLPAWTVSAALPGGGELRGAAAYEQVGGEQQDQHRRGEHGGQEHGGH